MNRICLETFSGCGGVSRFKRFWRPLKCGIKIRRLVVVVLVGYHEWEFHYNSRNKIGSPNTNKMNSNETRPQIIYQICLQGVMDMHISFLKSWNRFDSYWRCFTEFGFRGIIICMITFPILLVVFFLAWFSSPLFFPSSKNYYEDGVDDPQRPIYYINDYIVNVIFALIVTLSVFILFSFFKKI